MGFWVTKSLIEGVPVGFKEIGLVCPREIHVGAIVGIFDFDAVDDA